MSKFSKNFYNFKYDDRRKWFIFPSKSVRDSFRSELYKYIKNPDTKIHCNENTFSAKDEKSKEFVSSEFYELMCESVDVKNSKDLIRKIDGYFKTDINYDEYYPDYTMFRLMKDDPCSYIDKETNVCHIFRPIFHDEDYDYPLYVKLDVNLHNEVVVMSLHWNDNGDKWPTRVWNRKTNEYDSVDKAIEKLREKLDYYPEYVDRQK